MAETNKAKAAKATRAGRKGWFVIACNGNSETGKTVKLAAPQGKAEAEAMAANLAKHGWGGHYEGDALSGTPGVATGKPSVVHLDIENNDPRFPAIGK